MSTLTEWTSYPTTSGFQLWRPFSPVVPSCLPITFIFESLFKFLLRSWLFETLSLYGNYLSSLRICTVSFLTHSNFRTIVLEGLTLPFSFFIYYFSFFLFLFSYSSSFFFMGSWNPVKVSTVYTHYCYSFLFPLFWFFINFIISNSRKVLITMSFVFLSYVSLVSRHIYHFIIYLCKWMCIVKVWHFFFFVLFLFQNFLRYLPSTPLRMEIFFFPFKWNWEECLIYFWIKVSIMTCIEI